MPRKTLFRWIISLGSLVHLTYQVRMVGRFMGQPWPCYGRYTFLQNFKVNSRSLPQGEPDVNFLVGSLSWEPSYCALKKYIAVTYRKYKDTYWRTPLRFLTQLVLACVEFTRINFEVNWVRMVLRWMDSYSTNPKHSQNARFSHTFWLNWGA